MNRRNLADWQWAFALAAGAASVWALAAPCPGKDVELQRMGLQFVPVLGILACLFLLVTALKDVRNVVAAIGASGILAATVVLTRINAESSLCLPCLAACLFLGGGAALLMVRVRQPFKIVLVVALVAVPTGLFFEAHRSRPWTFDLAIDPSKDPAEVPVELGLPDSTVLVYASNCAGCSRSRMQGWIERVRFANPKVALRVIYSTDEKTGRPTIGEESAAYCIWDPDRTLQSRLNAAPWRCYAIRRGKIVWAQPAHMDLSWETRWEGVIDRAVSEIQ